MAGDDPVALCSAVLRDRIAPLLPPSKSVALLGFPENHNCGDHADWLGVLALLRELGVQPRVQGSWARLQPDLPPAISGGDALLLSNVFSTTGKAASSISRIIASGANPVILLPERLLSDRAPDAALITAISRHAAACVLAREPVTAKTIAQAGAGNVRIELAPPPSFLLGPQSRRTEPEYDLVWVARTGHRDGSVEAAARLSSQSAEKLDLPVFADGLEIDIVAKCRPPTVMLTDWSSLVFRSQEARLSCNALELRQRAEAWFERGLQILSLGRVVITDRVGAHVMCLLLGLPHVFVDDGTGANRSFFETWTRSAQNCRFADTPARGWTTARTMLREMNQ